MVPLGASKSPFLMHQNRATPTLSTAMPQRCTTPTATRYCSCAVAVRWLTGVQQKITPLRTYMATIDPDKLGTVEPKDITSTIYGLFSSTSLTGLFPTSGEMCRSKYINKGTNNRIYLALATNIDAKVIYTDDLGKTWPGAGRRFYANHVSGQQLYV